MQKPSKRLEIATSLSIIDHHDGDKYFSGNTKNRVKGFIQSESIDSRYTQIHIAEVLQERKMWFDQRGWNSNFLGLILIQMLEAPVSHRIKLLIGHCLDGTARSEISVQCGSKFSSFTIVVSTRKFVYPKFALCSTPKIKTIFSYRELKVDLTLGKP